MSVINNYSVKDDCVKFQLNNSKGLYKISLTNAIRRILISYIECYTIDINDIKFIENNSLFNNEFLKKRLSLIPIISDNNEKYEFLQITCTKKNNGETIEDIYSSDFKIKDKTTDRELNIKDYIPSEEILFSKLQLEQYINFEANLIKGTAFHNGASFSPVSSCVVTFHNSDYDKEPTIERERNYDLNSKNSPKIYEFYYENIGFFKSENLIKLALNILIQKLEDLKLKFDNYEYKNDFYYFYIKDENDTLGNFFTAYLLDNKEITYSGYTIEHPLKNNIEVKIKTSAKKDKLMTIIQSNIDNLIDLIKNIKKEFK